MNSELAEKTSITNKPLSIISLYDLSSHNATGDYGEVYAQELFLRHGYIVQRRPLEHFSGDLRVVDTLTGEIIKIDVKTATQARLGFGFCLRKHKHTNCSYSDFVLLICIDNYNNHYEYLIPSSLLHQQFIRITSHPIVYSGKYSSFLLREDLSIKSIRDIAELWSVK